MRGELRRRQRRDKTKPTLMAVAKELNEPLVIECDVTQPQQVEAMMKQIQDQRGGLDILVNNSGIISDRTIKKMSPEEFESVIRVNLIGTFTCDAESGSDSAQRRTSDQHVVGERADGTVRPGKLFLE